MESAKKGIRKIIINKFTTMTYADYPEAAKNNAKRALKHKEDNGSSCGTNVGWLRANQIAKGESLSEDTVQRTYSFLSRAEVYDQGKYFDEDGNEICGSIMYDAWGGSAMKTWAEAKFKQIEREKEKNSLMANVNIDILGEISEYQNSFNYLKYKIDEAKGEAIDFTISSGGGSVTEGMGMADLIANYPGETTAKGIGLVASIATVVLLSAKKVKMTENSFLMIHRPWSQAVGNSEELEATADLLDKMEEKLLDIYVNAVEKRGGGTEMNLRKKIKKMLAAETWLTAQEAKEFGFIDEIVKTGEKNIDLLPLQSSLSKFTNVPAALLINKNDDDMGNTILEKIKNLLNQTEEVTAIEPKVEPIVEPVKVDDLEVAMNVLKEKGYTVLSVEEMNALTEKSNEQTTSINEIETVLETLGAELVALRAQVKKGVGLPSGGSANEKTTETKAKSSHFDSFASLVKNKISQR
jgi:ATP-dependent protease ClpP protease subunit